VTNTELDLKTRKAIFSTLKKNNPVPTTELEYKSDFQLLIAVILSAQATDIGVNKATKQLFIDAPDAQSIFALGETGLKKYVRTIGLFNSKAKNIIKTCEILLRKYDGQVPKLREQLEELPGVGRKTANVVLNTAFGEPTIAVDTHIFRVSNRTGLAAGKTPRQVEDQLIVNVPKQYLKDAHHWLILLGRYICKARKPQCCECPIKKYCLYENKTSDE
jgi:endonuclease III